MKVGVEEIYNILPHRYPFLFVDKIIDLSPGKKATGLKAITSDEDILLMSPSLVIEAMAQVAGITLSFNNQHRAGDYSGYLIEVKDFSFLEEIHIGDRLFFDIELTQKFGNLFRFTGKARAGDRIIAKGELSIAIVSSTG
ncbi:MAG: 3-hydroxyacyl-ACP dehydratase FabZ family protein [Nitrospirota bacterium]